MTDYPNNIPAKLEIIKASEIIPKEVCWLWYPYIPFSKVTLLQGAPGDGNQLIFFKEDEKSLTFGDDRIREAVEKYNAKLLILYTRNIFAAVK